MHPLTWIRLGISSVIFSGVLSLGYLGYAKIQQTGYDKASEKYQKIITEQKELIDVKIASLEKLSYSLSADNKARAIVLSSDIAGILRKVNATPLTVIKEGTCTPAPIFSETINSVNQRVNQSIRDTQK